MLSKAAVCAVLPCRNLKAAHDFYRKKLGLKLLAGSVEEGHLEFVAGQGSVLACFESSSTKSNDTAASFEVKDLEKEMAALRKKGVKFENYDLPGTKTVKGIATEGNHRAAWFKDPGGNVICLHSGVDVVARKRRVRETFDRI
jgi:catechol 2,3-dioxygenase-like lactoylglutathione lyase family enzyme